MNSILKKNAVDTNKIDDVLKQLKDAGLLDLNNKVGYEDFKKVALIYGIKDTIRSSICWKLGGPCIIEDPVTKDRRIITPICISKRAENFVMGHELGHVVLGHVKSSQLNENEANYFAEKVSGTSLRGYHLSAIPEQLIRMFLFDAKYLFSKKTTQELLNDVLKNTSL